jgi:hypothetical protein
MTNLADLQQLAQTVAEGLQVGDRYPMRVESVKGAEHKRCPVEGSTLIPCVHSWSVPSCLGLGWVPNTDAMVLWKEAGIVNVTMYPNLTDVTFLTKYGHRQTIGVVGQYRDNPKLALFQAAAQWVESRQEAV